MKHIPHVVVAAPWPEETLAVSVLQWRHLTKVLKLNRGDTVSYTDGLGTVGQGRLGAQTITRGEEGFVERSSALTVAMAPPASKDRQRFAVEKLAELGVARLIWLESRHGKDRVASPAKVFSWVLSATEQSRGAWLMETTPDLVRLSDLEGEIVMCHPGGTWVPGDANVVVIGPEGGWSEDEIPMVERRWDLGPNILRVETAAVVAAGILLRS